MRGNEEGERGLEQPLQMGLRLARRGVMEGGSQFRRQRPSTSGGAQLKGSIARFSNPSPRRRRSLFFFPRMAVEVVLLVLGEVRGQVVPGFRGNGFPEPLEHLQDGLHVLARGRRVVDRILGVLDGHHHLFAFVQVERLQGREHAVGVPGLDVDNHPGSLPASVLPAASAVCAVPSAPRSTLGFCARSTDAAWSLRSAVDRTSSGYRSEERSELRGVSGESGRGGEREVNKGRGVRRNELRVTGGAGAMEAWREGQCDDFHLGLRAPLTKSDARDELNRTLKRCGT